MSVQTQFKPKKLMKRVFSKLNVSRSKTLGSGQDNENVFSSSSIVARAGQIMALVIFLGVVSMVASMLVAESLGGDAEKINKAGALRMQALRISRAYILDAVFFSPNRQLAEKLNETHTDGRLTAELSSFDSRIRHLFDGGLTQARDDEAIEIQYQKILDQFNEVKKLKDTLLNIDESNQLFESFVEQIDRLVLLLQQRSEAKLSLLRFIQGIGLLGLLVIAFAVLFSLNRSVIVPLKEIVSVAENVGKGDFSVKASYQSDNELGMLASAINQMSSELELIYKDFEQRVITKTKELTESNRSLQTLYQAANQLAAKDYQQSDEHIINDLEQALGVGKITIEHSDARVTIEDVARTSNDSSRDLIQIEQAWDVNEPFCLKPFSFPLEKGEQNFGSITWHLPINTQPKAWQTKILKAMADIMFTAVDLQQKRNSENRLLIMEERAVIARELHDSLAQSLSYLKVQMSLLTKKMDKKLDSDVIEETIDDIKNGLNSAYRQLRELLTTFRLKLDDPSLFNALQGTTIEFSERCQHPIELDFDLPKDSLSANQEIHVLQIIREALSNVHRHSSATLAGVSLKDEQGKKIVEVWDNGIGIDCFEPRPTTSGHFGLGIMQERASSLGSQIQICARKPKGAIVRFEFG
jgi:two-component system nitrate/nitrite sensor histidine kinase NarX